jgi:uncharacterized delta-60 repeat protein
MMLFSRKTRRDARVRSIHRRSSPRLEHLENRTLLDAGMLDPTFGVGGKATTAFPALRSQSGNNMALQGDGKIVLAGTAGFHFAVARLNSDGTPDTSFGTAGRVSIDFNSSDDEGYSVAMGPGGKIIVVGTSYQAAVGYAVFALARLNSDGTLDTSFGALGKLTLNLGESTNDPDSVAVQPDGRIVLAGATYHSVVFPGGGSGLEQDFTVTRLNIDGSFDSTFGNSGRQDIDFGGYDLPTCVAIGAGGTVAVAGYSFQASIGQYQFAVTRLNADGNVDSTFGVGGEQLIGFDSAFSVAYAVTFQADNKLVVVGDSDQGASGHDFAVARLNQDGTVDNTFDGDGRITINFGAFQDYATGVAVQSDGKIVVGGTSFQNYAFAVARLNSDGSFDADFGAGGLQTVLFDSGCSATALALQPDGKIVLGGYSGYDFAVARLLGRTVNAAPTVTTLTASPSTSVSGQSVRFTATVTPQAGSPIPTATGSIQFEIDGINFGSPVPLVNGVAMGGTSDLSVASHMVSAVYTSDTAGFLNSTGSTSITVEDATVANIQAVVSSAPATSGGSFTLLTLSDSAVSTAVQAVNAASPSGPVTVTLDLGGGSYTTDTQVNTQPGVTLVITNGTLVGGSPALVVDSGNVILNNLTAQNTTNAPTIVLNGGSLVVRNSTIQESTGDSQAAILVTGGTVDLGTAANPGGNVLNVNGPGALIQNTSGRPIAVVGDTLENNGVAMGSAPSIFVLSPSASGALTVSNNTSITIPGVVIVESSSPTAVAAGSKAQLSAWASGTSVPDPLAGLASPSTTGLTSYGSVVLSGNSKISMTLNPGIYSQIAISGNASVTMNPGVYVIKGGGLAVSGSASIGGIGVMICNAGSNYPNPGGSFGGITLSGTGTFNLSAPVSGPYAGVVIFQSRQNTRALSISGSIMTGLNGAIYAPNALLSLSGGGQVQAALDVGMLSVSGGASLTQMADGTDGASDTSGIANTLLAGNLSVYVSDPSGLFTTDELARIQDAIDSWDAILASYSVTITEVSDPSLANLVIDTGTTSACGGADSGVLGCYDSASAEITILQGWSWYAGADASAIGAGQYDLETTATHELGHALGLGHSPNPGSSMYETLATGVANRAVTVQDLNIPDPPSGADPQRAAGFQAILPVVFPPVAPRSGSLASVGSIAVAPLDNVAMARDAALADWSSIRAGTSERITARSDALKGSRVLGLIDPGPVGSRNPVLDAGLVDALLGDTTSTVSLLHFGGNGHPTGKRKPAWRP